MSAGLSHLRRWRFSRGNLLPSQPESLWRIDIVRTITWSEAGNLNVLGYWGPEDVVGQPLSRLTPYLMECLTSVEVGLVPAHLWYLVLDAIILHTQQTEELLHILHHERIPIRLLQLLGWLVQKFGTEVDQGQLIDLRLTHEEIAEVLSTTRVTVTKLLKQFEQEGRIRRSRHHVILCHQQLSTLATTSKSPGWIPASIIESPLTQTKKVAVECLIR